MSKETLNAETFYENAKETIKIKNTVYPIDMFKAIMCEFAEAYHKAKVEEYPPICKRCDKIIRTELNQDN